MPPAKIWADFWRRCASRRSSSFLWGLVLQPLLGVVTPNPSPAARACSSAASYFNHGRTSGERNWVANRSPVRLGRRVAAIGAFGPELIVTMTRRRRITLVALGGVGLLFFFALHPLVRRVVKEAARKRGFSVEVGTVRFGVRGVWLKHMRSTCTTVPEFQVAIDSALFPWSTVVGSKNLRVYGADVRLPPNAALINSCLKSQRRAKLSEQQHLWELRFSGVHLAWQAAGQDARLVAWGLSGDASRRQVQAHADRIEGNLATFGGSLTGVAVDLKRSNESLALQKGSAQSGTLIVDLGSTRASTLTRISDPQPQPSTPPAAPMPPKDVIDRVVAAWLALQSYLAQARSTMNHDVAPAATFELSELNVRLQHHQQKLDIGPLHVQGTREPQSAVLTFEQLANPDSPRRFAALRLPNDPANLELEAEVDSVSLQTLGAKEGDFGLKGVADSKLAAAIKLNLDEPTSSVKWQASGELLDVNLEQPWLAPRIIEGISGKFVGKGVLHFHPGFALKTEELSLSVGKARVELVADIQRSAHETQANLELLVPLAACQDLVEALPKGLAPLASEAHLDGTLSLQAGIRFDTKRPRATDIKWNFANACRVRSFSPAISPERFHEPFILEVPDERAKMVEHAFGPGTANWVALTDMTDHLPHAILVCEDGRFYTHNGFDNQAIRNSIRDNLVQGRFVRGASTVSMQLAKNLYLRREKTFSRKLQEAVLTLLLEQNLSKDEIMELYLNVIELGPGIYGVGDASRFYFNTTPARLSPMQAYYLASLLPNPKVMHFGKDGHLAPGWLKLLRHLMTIAQQRHYLTDEELKQALEEEIAFGVSDTSRAAIPPDTGATDADNLLELRDANER